MWHLVDLPQGYHAVVGGKPGNLGLRQGKNVCPCYGLTHHPPITRHDAPALSDCLWNPTWLKLVRRSVLVDAFECLV
jgi:hypothetical protein